MAGWVIWTKVQILVCISTKTN